jgi:hypothetical protein
LIKGEILRAMCGVAQVAKLLKLYESVLQEICRTEYPKDFGNLDDEIVRYLS